MEDRCLLSSLRHGMREPNSLEEVAPVRLNTSELRIMALRQQQQIDTQQQLLAAREQRLRFLKAQEACETVAAAEGERLRRLRERVEAQESKLRRLRALRGQVDLQKTYNVTLGNDLDSIRALFSEKEKELTLAVAKVEALTRQLEDLRRDRRGTLNLFTGLPSHPQLNSSPAAIELDKLRRELMYRNQLSLQQDARLHLQREALQKRQAELQSVDQRILELQGRLNKKRASNMIQHQQNSPTQMTLPNNANHVRSVSSSFYPQQRVPRSNIVAVEPFNHIPQKTVALGNNGNKMNILNNNSVAANQIMQDLANSHKMQHGRQLSAELNSNTNLNDHNMAAESDENKLARQKKQEYVLKNGMEYDNDATFGNSQVSQSSGEQINNNKTTYMEREVQNDELILNNRYGYNIDQNIDNSRNMCSSNSDAMENLQLSNTNDCDSDKVSDMNGLSSRAQVTATVHSTPLSFLNKSVAVPVTLSSNSPIPNDEQNQQVIKSKAMQGNSKGFAYGLLHNIPSGNLVVPPRKPNSGLSPMMAGKHLSSDIKINMVTPQIQNQHISQSTDNGEKLKPALPPKPNKNNTQIHETDTGVKSSADNVSNNNEQMSSVTNIPSKLSTVNPSDNLPIKAKPLTIKKSPHSEQPRLKHISSNINSYKVLQTGANRMMEMQSSTSYMLPEVGKCTEESESQLITDAEKQLQEYNNQTQRSATSKRSNVDNQSDVNIGGGEESQSPDKKLDEISRRKRSFISNVVNDGKIKLARRVSFDPLALLLDASLEGELELVQKTALQVPNPSAANDEGITALHNAICAGHVEIVKFLVNFGCDVNAQDSDGWTPLHCAASCNNLSMVKFLVESGACLFAATLSDHETPAEKCEEDEEGFDGCSEYLYSIQEKLGILNSGEVYAVFSYDAQQPDELSFSVNDKLTVIRKGDESEREWWWAKDSIGNEGYIPRNLLGFYPRVTPCSDNHVE